jgi:hypothetical protein
MSSGAPRTTKTPQQAEGSRDLSLLRAATSKGGRRGMTIRLDAVYVPSDDVVAREIEGELIIVPLVAGIGDMEDELYTLNESGKAIWDRLDGETTLRKVVATLAQDYNAPPREIEHDVLGLVDELARRRMLVEAAVV